MVRCIDNTGHELILTLNKEYELLKYFSRKDTGEEFYVIKNNEGIVAPYYINRFETIGDDRSIEVQRD